MTIHQFTPKKDIWDPSWFFCNQKLNEYLKSHPEHEVKYWTDEDIDSALLEDDKDFFNNYLNKLHFIYKIDYFKYYVLEKHGGVYMDLDIEILIDFLRFTQDKIYLMEGTNGDLLENSLIVSDKDRKDIVLWNELRQFAKNKIISHFKKCKESTYNTFKYVGSGLLTEFFIKYSKNYNCNWEILGYYQFSDASSTISFTKHYYSKSWDRPENIEEEIK